MTAEHAGVVRSPLAARLIAGFVTVAVTAVFVLAGLTLWRTKHSVGNLARERQQATADAIADTLALGFEQANGWAGIDPHAATMLAVQAGATLIVVDRDGDPLDLSGLMGHMPDEAERGHGPQRTAPIVVGGDIVGTAVVTFTSGELGQAEMHVRDALRGTVLIGAVVAALIAAAIAVPLARRIVRPLRRVTDVARRLGAGDPDARVGDHAAPGEIGRLARTFDDMADRLQANDLARRNLTADVAHELRTPLTLLQGSCEEVIDGIAEPSIEQFVQMHDDILRLRRVVDDLGELAEADAATTEPRVRFETCDLAAVAAGAADAVQPLVDSHQHRLERNLQSAPVDGDPARLGQIITNLLGNAIKFTPPGGSIALDVHADTDRGAAVLSVSDDGPGIRTADQPHVFERFYRGEQARPIAGSGIGLAVVAQLVKAHGGTVKIDDAATGTTVIVSLPLIGNDQTSTRPLTGS